MTRCVLEPARSLGGWNEEVKEEVARNKAGEVAREGHAEPPGPGEKVGRFILVSKEQLKARSRGRDTTMLEFWKPGVESTRGKGGTAGWVAREEPPQTGVREREGARGDEGKGGFQELSALPHLASRNTRPEAYPGL